MRGISAPHERFLGWIATLRPGEGRSVVLFFTYAFLLLVCYYVAENGTRAAAVGGWLGGPEELRDCGRGTRAARFRPGVRRRVPPRDQERHRLRDYAFLRCEPRCFLCGLPTRASISASSITSSSASSGSPSSRNFGPTRPTLFQSTAASVCFPSSWPVRRWAGSRAPWSRRFLYYADDPASLLLVAAALLAATLPLVGGARDWCRRRGVAQ